MAGAVPRSTTRSDASICSTLSFKSSRKAVADSSESSGTWPSLAGCTTTLLSAAAAPPPLPGRATGFGMVRSGGGEVDAVGAGDPEMPIMPGLVPGRGNGDDDDD